MTETLLQDLRYAFRTLRRSPGFTVVAVLTLALGIGANTTIFSLVNGVMLRPLPFRDPGRLVRVWESSPSRNWTFFSMSQPDFLDYREQNHSFERLAATMGFPVTLTEGDAPERITGLAVSPNFFATLGITPLVGRDMLPEEGSAGRGSRIVLISHGLWQRRFGSRRDIVGSTISLDEQPYSVIGVVPTDLTWSATDVFVPLVLDRNRPRGDHRLTVIGRLKLGVTLAQAQFDLATIAQRLEETYPGTNNGWTVVSRTFYDWLIPEETRRALGILQGAVAFVLLIACANVANLMLARAAARHGEVAIRTAMGAARSRIVRQLLTEAVLVALLGGALGLLVVVLGLRAIRGINPGDLPRLDTVSVDWAVLLFTLGVSVLTGLLFGLAPALRSTRRDLTETLKQAGRGTTGGTRNRLRSSLVIVEVSLSLVLLVGAGLLLRSFWRVLQVQPGFETQNLLTATVSLSGSRYSSTQAYVAFHQELTQRLRALPGVRAVGLASGVPLDRGGTAMDVYIEGRAPGSEQPSAEWRRVSSGYFRAMGIPQLRGRDLREDDAREAVRGVVISDAMARRFWPGEDPIGRQFRSYSATQRKPVGSAFTVVGVVGDVRNFGLDAAAGPVMYLPYEGSVWNPMRVVLRTEGDPRGYTAALRDVVRALDPILPVANIQTMDELLDSSLAPRQFSLLLLGAFAALALGLAAAGLYGVMSYVATQRTHEVGVRLALGAQQADILRMVVRRCLVLTATGVGVGLVGALWLTRLLRTLLFEVSGADPATFTGVAVLLTIVAVLACWLPARRAARVDPMVALRSE